MLPRSASRSRRQNSKRSDAEKRVPGYLQWLRGRPCAVGGTCAGRIEAAHVSSGTDAGMATKASDQYAIPLCAAHHAEQHQAGVRTFEVRHSINMLERSRAYWQAWMNTPMGLRWRTRDGQ